MNYNNFKFDNDNYIILCEIETYTRTISGKSWRSKPDTIERKAYNSEQYTNYITAIPFFNNFSDGASCRAKWSYEAPGYLPTKINTISPFKEKKKVATFKFLDKRPMMEAAGWREQYIVNNVKSYKLVNCDDALITLYTYEEGACYSGLYDITRKQWRG